MDDSLQNPPPEPAQTDQTDQTDCPILSDASDTAEAVPGLVVSNATFLKTLFGALLPTLGMPALVYFPGKNTNFRAYPWHGSDEGAALLRPDWNNYVSQGVFALTEEGAFRRRKEACQGIAAIVLDDIGTKVDLDRLTLPPSWRLETSPGNFQIGYLLDQPLQNMAEAEALSQAFIAAGLTDPGMSGPSTRLFRLPQGGNGKYTPPFLTRMHEWAPERRYTVQQLADHYDLDLTAKPAKKGRSPAAKGARATSGALYQPRPTDNPVLAALQARGLYKQDLGDGKHDITCPWCQEHTDQDDNGTAYFEPDSHYPGGGFHCFHGHCAERHLAELLDFLGIARAQAAMKACIEVRDGDFHLVLQAFEQVLVDLGHHFQMAGALVRVAPEPGRGGLRIERLTQADLTVLAAEQVEWLRYDGRSQDLKRKDPPGAHLNKFFELGRYERLPVLKGLACQPYLREDGELVATPGYDPDSGLYGTFAAGAYALAPAPTRAEAEAALAGLRDLLSEFPFKTAHDEAAALAALLTAALRASLPNAPLIHVRAHSYGSGKTMLCELIAALATPRPPDPASFPADNEECVKLLLSMLLAGQAVVLFDNLSGDLQAHPCLCSTLTAGQFSGRLLGGNQIATVEARTLFLSNGNNVGPVKDMTRRCLTIDLDPQDELPAMRQFRRPQLLDEVQAQREHYVGLALTVVRAWLAAGAPRDACPPLAGFSRWCDWVRQPLLWLCQPDPLTGVFVSMDQDPERELLGRLLAAWQACFGTTATLIRDALRHTLDGGWDPAAAELREVFQEIAGEQHGINTKRLGRFIARNKNKVVDGLRFRDDGASRSVKAWQVEAR